VAKRNQGTQTLTAPRRGRTQQRTLRKHWGTAGKRDGTRTSWVETR